MNTSLYYLLCNRPKRKSKLLYSAHFQFGKGVKKVILPPCLLPYYGVLLLYMECFIYILFPFGTNCTPYPTHVPSPFLQYNYKDQHTITLSLWFEGVQMFTKISNVHHLQYNHNLFRRDMLVH